MKRSISFFILIALTINLFSQYKSSCRSAEVHKEWLENNQNYRFQFEDIQASMEINQDTGQVLTIPIVFHVIHLGEEVGTGSNISEANILNAVSRINNDFEGANDLGLDIGIRFCLAKVDPNGQPTNGITRYDGSNINNYAAQGISYGLSAGLNELTIKSNTGWPNTRYYNIWVVHNIVGGWGGYAYFPSTNLLDGTVILDYLVNSQYDVLTHELGHAFNLSHTFEGDFDNTICPNNNNCNANGDFICDTPPHKVDDCGPTNPCTDEGNWDYSRTNLMSYCPNGTLITPGQMARMRNAAISYPRNLLNNSSNYVCADEITFDIELTSINHPFHNSITEQCGNSILGEFTVTNLGNVPIRQFSIEYEYDGNSNNKVYYANLFPGASKEFNLPDYEFPNMNASGIHQLDIEILNANETIDDFVSNNSLSSFFEILDTCTITNIKNEHLSKIKIYPTLNSSNTLNLSGLPANYSTNIRIVDIAGRVIVQQSTNQNNLTLDISEFTKGLYFVIVEIEGASICRKLVLQ